MNSSSTLPTESRRGLLLGLPRLLLVEDDDELRRSLEKLLARDGYEVVAVGSGLSALDELDSTRALDRLDPEFDVVVSDVHLPGVSGIHLAHSIATKYGRSKTILMTSFPTSEVVDEAVRLGVALISKPFHPEFFRRIVLATIESEGSGTLSGTPYEAEDP